MILAVTTAWNFVFLTIICVLVAALGVVLILLRREMKKELGEIYVRVDGRLSAAMTEIGLLRKHIDNKNGAGKSSQEVAPSADMTSPSDPLSPLVIEHMEVTAEQVEVKQPKQNDKQ